MNEKNKWIIIALGCIAVLYIIIMSMSNLLVPDDIKILETSEDILEKNKEQISKIEINNMDRADILNTMHHMSNTLIVADDIWGETPITNERVIHLMAEVSSSPFIIVSEKEKLLNILNEWEKNDFSQGVAQHNYLWNLLGGNIGKAKALREEYKK